MRSLLNFQFYRRNGQFNCNFVINFSKIKLFTNWINYIQIIHEFFKWKIEVKHYTWNITRNFQFFCVYTLKFSDWMCLLFEHLMFTCQWRARKRTAASMFVYVAHCAFDIIHQTHKDHWQFQTVFGIKSPRISWSWLCEWSLMSKRKWFFWFWKINIVWIGIGQGVK